FMLSQFLTDKFHALRCIDRIGARRIAANEIDKILISHFQIADITMRLFQRGITQKTIIVLLHIGYAAYIVSIVDIWMLWIQTDKALCQCHCTFIIFLLKFYI